MLYKNLTAINIAVNMIKRTRENMNEQNILFPTYTMGASRLKTLNTEFDAILFMYNGLVIFQKNQIEKNIKIYLRMYEKGWLVYFYNSRQR